jgi:hypothetical protein
MIVFDLQCGHAHVFEAWFGSSADYDSQQQRGLISCPVCNDSNVTKAVMAPAVPAKGNSRSDAMAALLAAQRKLEAQSEYVGSDFAARARAIHDAGDTTMIYGEASADEARALHEDGIAALPLPFRPLIRSDA